MSIITVSREMAAGALPISEKAAEQLGYTLLDGQKLRDLASSYGLSAEEIDQADEKRPAFVEHIDSQLLITLSQIEMIVLDVARKGDVLIHGRAARDVLLNIDHIFNVRIIAPFSDRVERLAEEEWLDPDVALQMVRKSDQQRAGFLKYYFDRDWADPLSYDLVINSRGMSEDTAARLIVEGARCPIFTQNQDQVRQALERRLIQKKIQIAYLQMEQAEGVPFDITVEAEKITLSGNVTVEKERASAHAAVKTIVSEAQIEDRMRVTDPCHHLNVE